MKHFILAITTMLTVGTGCEIIDVATSPSTNQPPSGNVAPTANAGPDQVLTATDVAGVTVTLDGSHSTDGDGTVESWVWSENGVRLATGDKPAVTLTPGVHDITLTVTDDAGLQSTDVVRITVHEPGANPPPGNQRPSANAGPDQTVTAADSRGASVTLDGSRSSDADGHITAWVWSEGNSEIATGQSPTVTLQSGQHQITLTVTDDQGDTGTDLVLITVREPVVGPPPGNQSPSANAGPDQTVTAADSRGASVTLDGSGSSDADGRITAWVWSEGSSQIATGQSPTVTLQSGRHDITLTVTDDQGDTDTDQVVIIVQAANRVISYAVDIQPYFDAHCIRCHQGGSGDRGVNVDTYANLMAGGRSGALVVPGDPSKGLLIPKLEAGHKSAPHGTTIIEDLKSWVADGAKNN